MTTQNFKYQLLNEAGQPTTFLSKKGSFDGELLDLAGESYRAADILHTMQVKKAFIFVVPVSDGEPKAISILMHSGNVKQLRSDIDRIRSAVQVGKEEEAWQAGGRVGVFRKEQCPCCTATLNLSRFEPTPQLFCDYCDTVFTVPIQPETPKNEVEYKLCEHCGMYSHPRHFTEFYFYFLFVIYGYWTNESTRCPACMRGTAWKMLAVNFLFVIGIIPAVYQLIRAYASDKIAGPFSGLHAANLKATKRNYSAATKIYQSILDRVPFAAGVHYNLGLALVQNKEWERASAAFELSLDDCSNYRYAAGGLMHCYEALGRTDDFKAMQTQWGSPEAESETPIDSTSAQV